MRRLFAAVLVLTVVGCKNENERLVEMAEQHAARQADAQRQMAELHKQLAEGSRQLVEADAKAREKLTSLQHDLRADQAEIGHQRDQLEADRRQIAEQRHRDPLIAAAIMDVGLVLACLLPLAVCIFVLWTVRHKHDADDALIDLLIEEVVADQPRFLLPRPAPLAIGGQPADGPRLDDDPPEDSRSCS